jgi:hypothetical protein
VRVGSHGKAIDHLSGQEVRGPFTSPSFRAGFGGTLAISGAGEVCVLTNNLVTDPAGGIRLNLAPAGDALQSLGMLTNVHDIEFADGALWGARTPTILPPVELVKIALPSLAVESKGAYQAYPFLKAGSIVIVGQGQFFKVALDAFTATTAKCNECDGTRSQNYTTAESPFRRTSGSRTA